MNGKPFVLRVPPREAREAKTYDVDPEAVANLRRILAEREAEKQEKKKRAFLRRAAERRQASAAEAPAATSPAVETTPPTKDETTDEASDKKEKANVAQTNFKEVMTPERAATWARWRREKRSYDYITKTDELHPSAPTIKGYLEKYGYTTQGEPVGQQAPAPAQRAKPSPRSEGLPPAVVAPAPSAVANGAAALPAEQVASQLQAIQKLMQSVQAGEVRVTGKIRMELNVEIEVG